MVVAIEETEGDEDATEGKIGLDSGFLSGGEVFRFGFGRGKRKQKKIQKVRGSAWVSSREKEKQKKLTLGLCG